MQYPLYATVRAGREYSKQWPEQAELSAIAQAGLRLTRIAAGTAI